MKQIRVDRPEDAADQVVTLIVEQPARLVRIDGHSASGKSSLAKQLARLLTGTHVDTDVYLLAGMLLQEQLIENLAQYVASGLYVILEGIKLEERCPSAGMPAFCILLTSEFEDNDDRIRSDEIAAELGVDRYFDQYRPAERANVEVVVRVASESAALVAAMEGMNDDR